MVTFLRSRGPGDVATVPPAVADVEYGIQRLPVDSRRRELLSQERDRLLSAIRVLEWTPRSSPAFGSIKAELERTGEPVDDFDIAIAAIARSHGAEVLTANLPHYRRIPGLRSRHWRVAAHPG